METNRPHHCPRTPVTPFLLISGALIGGLLGFVNGFLCHAIIGGFDTWIVPCACGVGLGLMAGVGYATLRAWTQKSTIFDIGTPLGIAYGCAPGFAMLYQVRTRRKIKFCFTPPCEAGFRSSSRLETCSA